MAREMASRQGRDDDLIALDRSTVRSYDADGRLHIKSANISKATVNPYIGREIPDWEKLGLNPDQVYRLFRDPAEIEKAAPSFNGLPLLIKHVPVSADDHQPDQVVGAVGTDAEFKAPYLTNALVIWAREAIDGIETEKQKELSCAYRYRADMTPGTYEGATYDGVMRDIIGNHVALVPEGRAGSDVVVGDAVTPKLKELMQMSTVKLSRKAAVALGALVGYLKPRLAQDAKIDWSSLAGVTAKNFADHKAAIAASLKAQVTGGTLKLAKDANIDGVVELLDALQAVEPEATDDEAAPAMKPADVSANDDEPTKFLKGKLSAEDWKAYDDMMKTKTTADEAPEEKKKREEAEAAKKAQDEEEKKDMVTKPAMDAAIAAAVKAASDQANANQKAIRDAERDVRPWVGDLAMAHDSADAVYRTALGALSVDVKEVKETAALKAILHAQPKPGATKRETAHVAMDAASTEDFAKRFPHAAKIGTL